MDPSDSALPAKIAPIPGWSALRGTLAAPVRVSGRGLHTGRRCQVTLLPADAGNGVVFRRMRKDSCQAEVPASWTLNVRQPQCTALKSPDGTMVRTTEHLLAALWACGIDDVTVEMTREELPILDGSARPWIEAIRDAGRRDLAVPRRFIQIVEPVVWDNAPHHMRLEPTPMPGLELAVGMVIDGLGEWQWQGQLTPGEFAEQVSAARSFGQVKYAIPGILYGLVTGKPILRGAGPWCAAAIVGDRVIGGKRMPDEFVRHKIVDMLGDLALLGAPLLGRLVAERPTHYNNSRLMQMLMRSPHAWRYVEMNPATDAADRAAARAVTF